MNGKGKLTLSLVDVYGEVPNDQVDISLKHTVLSDSREVRNRRIAARMSFPDLDSTQGGRYRLLIYPRRYRPVSRFVQVRESQTTLENFVLPVDPDKVMSVEAPEYSDLADDLKQILESADLESHAGSHGEGLYNALDDIRKAALLNLYAKMKATLFVNGRDVFSYIAKLTRLRGDRFFARVKKDLRDETKNSISAGLFNEASGQLHTPPPEFVSADSSKTVDRYGNLQLTFFSKPSTLEFIVDTDIDEAQDIGHVFDVLHEALTGQPTNPYNIHEILLESQKIDPKYRLVV